MSLEQFVSYVNALSFRCATRELMNKVETCILNIMENRTDHTNSTYMSEEGARL